MDCGFSKFVDGSKFKYNEYGEICLKGDYSNWSKRLLNNLTIEDYIDNQYLNPQSDFLTFPNFGNKISIKKRKETIGNYIENCELCDKNIDKAYKYYKKLVCKECIKNIEKETCTVCFEKNIYCQKFIESDTSIYSYHKNPKILFASDDFFYCQYCYDNLIF